MTSSTDPTPRAEGLRKYARHLHGCAVLMPIDSWDCTCGLVAALAASDTAPGLDVRRVKQAVTNIAVRHGLTKDPPEPNWTLHSMYGYSRSTPDMDAEIAAEYARLASPDPTGTPTD